MKNIRNETKKAIKIFNIRVSHAEERICELKDRSLDVIQLEEKKRNKNKKTVKKAYGNYRIPSIAVIFALWEYR